MPADCHSGSKSVTKTLMMVTPYHNISAAVRDAVRKSANTPHHCHWMQHQMTTNLTSQQLSLVPRHQTVGRNNSVLAAMAHHHHGISAHVQRAQTMPRDRSQELGSSSVGGSKGQDRCQIDWRWRSPENLGCRSMPTSQDLTQMTSTWYCETGWNTHHTATQNNYKTTSALYYETGWNTKLHGDSKLDKWKCTL